MNTLPNFHPTRWLVCGGRDFSDEHRLDTALNSLMDKLGPPLVLIQGGARGADSLARLWAKSVNIEVLTFHAHWRSEGKAAGSLRNARMLEKGRPDLVVAFPGGNGTRDMVSRARKVPDLHIIHILDGRPPS